MRLRKNYKKVVFFKIKSKVKALEKVKIKKVSRKELKEKVKIKKLKKVLRSVIS
jgi:flagellar biosynthesis component FlhA